MSFKTWRSYWDFSYSVKNKQRYIRSNDEHEFLNSLLDTCKERIRIIEPDNWVWRAQLGCEFEPIYQTDHTTDEEIYIDDQPIPYSFSRMKPLAECATEGRANPKGIPYLYVASDKETAMSEIRPWLRSTISLGTFRTTRQLKIIDFSVQHGTTSKFYFKEPTVDEIVKSVWCDIDNAFSKPTNNSDLTSEYVPTQIISEFIKSNGYDGIAYKSSLADGHNLALFDISSAEIFDCQLYNVSKIKFEFNK